MTIETTHASKELLEGKTSPHQLITLLMSGALERVAQAKQSIRSGDTQDEAVLLEKTVAILNGLRDSLNFDQGGEIALNLDSLYEYMIALIGDSVEADKSNKFSALDEVEALMSQVKSGWEGMQEGVAA